jgi:CheY-like chemotaxis protein
VESVFGGGSIFKFTIPLRYDKKGFKSNEEETSIICKETEGKTILVAEDDNINFLLLKTILQKKNHIVLRAKNGQEVVDISASNPNIDLIFMDIKMPVMDGYEAFELIKKENPGRIVIAQTAHSSIEVEESILKAGFSGYITKPLDKEKIFELINETFQNNSMS